jgi:hypothetical protein
MKLAPLAASGQRGTEVGESEEQGEEGRSRERVQQDRLLEREARRESWLARLWRNRRLAKGRPTPGNRAAEPRNER